MKRPDVPHGGRRLDVWMALGILAAVAALAWLVITLQQLGDDLRDANDARDLLARQVQTLGAKPVAGPPGSRGDPGSSVTGPKGKSGGKGARGASGSPGPSGSPGRGGDNGESGANGADATGSPGPSGAAGSNGTAGPPGAQGEPGPAGPPGEAGRDGTDGQDGQTCPDGYSLQAPADDPDALMCRRDGAPQPSPTDDDHLITVGMDPQRRQYR